MSSSYTTTKSYISKSSQIKKKQSNPYTPHNQKNIITSAEIIHQKPPPQHYPLTITTYHITTFNYQINKHNSKQIKNILNSLNYQKITKHSTTNLILFNTYSIHKSTNNHFITHLNKTKQLKSKNPKQIIKIKNY